MGKNKETGRPTKQNAASFKRDVNNTLAGFQANIDQLKAKSSEDAGTIAAQAKRIETLETKLNELITEFNASAVEEVKPDGNLSDKYLGDQLAATTGDTPTNSEA